MPMYIPSKHETLTQCCFNVGPTIRQHWDNASCLLCKHTPQGTIPHALLARLDDILGLAVYTFCPLHEIYLLCFYTGISVGLSIFRQLIYINLHGIYRVLT